MNVQIITRWLQNPLMETFGWTLLHSLWQLSLLAACAAILLFVFRRASANVRYVLCCAILALMPLLPVATFLHLLPSAPPATAGPIPSLTTVDPTAPEIPTLSASSIQIQQTTAPAPIPVPITYVGFLRPLLPYAVVVYFGGALLLSCRLLIGYAGLRQLWSRAIPASAALQAITTSLTRRLAISRPIRLLESALVEVPTVIGAIRPIILLPVTALSGLSTDQLTGLLAHELAHIRRHDYLINLFQTLFETLLFYHPALWWLSVRIRQEREHACDDIALSTGITRLTYAHALTQMESLRAPTVLTLAANSADLLPRIRRILQYPNPRARVRPSTFLALILPAVLLLGFLYIVGCNLVKPTGRSDTTATNPTGDVSLVRGKVLDAQGQPASAATVFLYYGRSPVGFRDRLLAKSTTDSSGAFAFADPLPWNDLPEAPGATWWTSRCYVLATLPDQSLGFATVFPGDPVNNLSIQLAPAKASKIQLLDLQARPITDAKVYVAGGQRPEAPARNEPRVARSFLLYQDVGLSSGQTNAQGEVEISAPPGATFLVQKDGFPRTRANAGKNTLTPAAQVNGDVTFANGSSAANIAVAYGQEEYGTERLTLTDAQGHFAFNDLPAAGHPLPHGEIPPTKGTATLNPIDLAPNSTLRSRPVRFPIQPGAKVTQNLVLNPGRIIGGKIVARGSNRPVANFRLEIWIYPLTSRPNDLSGQLDERWDLLTDREGSWRTVVPAGAYVRVLQAAPNAGGPMAKPGQDILAQTITKDVTDLFLALDIAPVGDLKGKVVRGKGEPVADVTLSVGVDIPAAPARSDKNGAFSLKAVPTTGPLEILATTKDKTLAALAPISVDGSESTITLQSTNDYAGQITTTDGKPASNLAFILDPLVNDGPDIHMRQEISTDAQGRFKALHLVPNAKYRGFWSDEDKRNYNYASGKFDFDLTRLPQDQIIRLIIKQYTNTIRGTVLNQNKQPVPNAQVAFDSQGDDLVASVIGLNYHVTTANAKGEFTVPRLAAGSIDLTVSATGYKTTLLTVPTNATPAITLDPPGLSLACDLLVVDETGKPLPFAPILLRERHWEFGFTSFLTVKKQTDAAGRLHIDTPTAPGRSKMTLVVCDIPNRDIALYSVPLERDAQDTIVVPQAGDHLKGRVTDNNGRPLADVQVTMTSWHPDAREDRGALIPYFKELGPLPAITTSSDQDGRFELARVASTSEARIELSKAGYSRETGLFHPDPAYLKRISAPQPGPNFSLKPAAIVKGKLLFPGMPNLQIAPGDAHVLLASPDDRFRHRLIVAADGSFADESLAPATYTVSPDFQTPALRKFVCRDLPTVEASLGHPADVTVTLQEGIQLHGKLLPDRAGQNPEGSSIFAKLKTDKNHRAQATAGAGGEWDLYLPREGDWDISYYIEGSKGTQLAETVKVEPGKTPPPLTIRLNGSSGPSNPSVSP